MISYKSLHTPYNIVVFITIGIITLSSPALAVPITYDITYDSSSGITTLSNSAGSLADLEFWTLTGSLQKTPLFLAPGDTVAVDAAGTISGRWHYDEGVWTYDNKTVEKAATIQFNENFRGTITINKNDYIIDDNYVRNNPETCKLESDKVYYKCQINLKKDDHFKIESTSKPEDLPKISVDAELSPITSYIDAYFQGPDWPGNPNQANIELLSGGLRSVDDTSTFTAIFTENVVTGCIPEPSILSLVALGLAGLWMGKRKLVLDQVNF